MSTKTNIFDNSKLKIEIDINAFGLTMYFNGRIDEDVNLRQVISGLERHIKELPVVELDLGLITEINSCGVREWILFLQKLQGAAKSIRFSLVNILMVEQTGMVPELLGNRGTPVMSFIVPFFCKKCQASSSMVLTSSQFIINNRIKLPCFLCLKCGNQLELDTFEESYTNIIKRSKA